MRQAFSSESVLEIHGRVLGALDLDDAEIVRLGPSHLSAQQQLLY